MEQRVMSGVRASSLPYLLTIMIAFLIGTYAEYLRHYLGLAVPLIFGQSPLVYVTALGVAVAAILWILYRGERTHEPLLVAFFGLLLLTWVIHWAVSRIHGDGFTYAVLLYGPIVAALLLKTPRKDDLLAALQVLGWGIVVILVGTRLLEFAGVIPMLDVGPDFIAYERENYWLPFAGTLGPESRWHGPFGHAARTGAAAAFLLVLAVGTKNRSRWVFGAVAIVTMLLASSRGSLIAAAAGVALIVLFSDNILTRRVRRSVLLVGIGLVGLIGLGGVLMRNPTLTGRTTYWQLAIEVWQQSPLIGSGRGGMQASELAIAGSNAHNILLDALVKFGLVGAITAMAALAVAVALAIQAARIRVALPLGIISTYAVLGISEADTEWMAITLPWLWLVLAATLAGRVREPLPTPIPALSSPQ